MQVHILGTNVPRILHVDFDVTANAEPNVVACTFTDDDTDVTTDLVIDANFDNWVNVDVY